VLDTDASNEQIGCVLQQKNENTGRLHPVGFWSRVLSPAEKKYSTVEKEGLAITWAVKTLRPYLEGKHFRIRSDQSSLSWIFSASSVDNPRLARFRLKLAGLSFSVFHLPGTSNQVADGLSRCETDGSTVDQPHAHGYDDVPCLLVREMPPRPGPLLEVDEWSAITVQEMREAQEKDEDCDRYRTLDGYDEDDDGLLVRSSPLNGTSRVVVPKALRERVLTLGHYPNAAGHPGSNRLYRSIRREFFWPGLILDCKVFVSRCPSCARQRLKAQKRTKWMKLFPPSAPLEFVGIGILRPLPETKRGNRFLLMMTDRFSKVTKVAPLRHITADDVAFAFFVHWVSCFGPPLILLSDNGSQFSARMFQAVCSMMGATQLFTSSYHPKLMGKRNDSIGQSWQCCCIMFLGNKMTGTKLWRCQCMATTLKFIHLQVYRPSSWSCRAPLRCRLWKLGR
jgi:RNase H-like domain found in reverse transcriptase/Integrase zinc binding domain/Integrase core domain